MHELPSLFCLPEPLTLESGEVLTGAEVAYHTFGTLNTDGSNVLWVCHALTANADALSWWPGLLGADCYFDPEDWFVVCANVLGSCYGSTSPLSPAPEPGSPATSSFRC